MLARSVTVGRGGALLRRPTEATQAPPAMQPPRNTVPCLTRQFTNTPKPSQAHHSAHNEGGPPVPPGRQRTTGITPKAAPSRPREEAISLAPHEVPPPTQAARGPGAAMALSRIGCHRAPFGSFPREGKNSPACPRHGQKSLAPSGAAKSPPPRAQRGRPTGAARPPADNRHSTPSPSCRPREDGISLRSRRFRPPSQAARGPGAAMVLSQIGCPRSPFGSFPRVGKNSLPHPRMCKRTPLSPKRKNAPLPAQGAKARSLQGPPLRLSGAKPRKATPVRSLTRPALGSHDHFCPSSGSSNQNVVPLSPLSTP